MDTVLLLWGCPTHCRMRVSQIRTRSAWLQDTALLPSELKAQLRTGPAWPTYCPHPSCGPTSGLNDRSSPLPHAHNKSVPLAFTLSRLTGSASV
eukprot:6465005-Amphidinium_carterae.1